MMFIRANMSLVQRATFVLLFIVMIGSVSYAQTEFVRECRQRSFPDAVPAGNYSGITRIGGNSYAVVSDKSEHDGFYVFEIDIDSINGELVDVKCQTFKGDSLRKGDCEGVVYCDRSSSFFICREADSSIVEYDEDGKLTGRRLAVPDMFVCDMGNYGFESLAYDSLSYMFWTINESTLPRDGQRATSQNGVENVLRLQSFDGGLSAMSQYVYKMDAPTAHGKSSVYAMGVSELAVFGDGRLLVLEREFYVPKKKIGAFVQCKLFEIEPSEEYSIPIGCEITESTKVLPKRLVHSFKTRLNLFDRSIANYEGMCIGPTLTDGSKVLILVSDSQDQYAGVLKDWFKTIVIR